MGEKETQLVCAGAASSCDGLVQRYGDEGLGGACVVGVRVDLSGSKGYNLLIILLVDKAVWEFSDLPVVGPFITSVPGG